MAIKVKRYRNPETGVVGELQKRMVKTKSRPAGSIGVVLSTIKPEEKRDTPAVPKVWQTDEAAAKWLKSNGWEIEP